MQCGKGKLLSCYRTANTMCRHRVEYESRLSTLFVYRNIPHYHLRRTQTRVGQLRTIEVNATRHLLTHKLLASCERNTMRASLTLCTHIATSVYDRTTLGDFIFISLQFSAFNSRTKPYKPTRANRERTRKR